MVLALIVMIVGIVVGVLLRRYNPGRHIAILLLFTVCLLLFIMGIRVATDPLITQNLYRIGGVALVIFIFVALGTMSAVWLCTKWIDSNNRKREG